jgi:hypothetical protein
MRLTKKILLPVLLSGLFLLYTGCAKATKPDDFNGKDGNAGLVAGEISDMDNTTLDKMQGLSKSLAATDTISITVVRSWQYDAVNGGWVREVKVNYPSGQRDRVDSVFFFDSAGNKLASPTLATTDSIYHVRTITRNFGSNTVDVLLKMNIRIAHAAAGVDTVIKNGTITGSYNGYVFGNVTVENVKRLIVNGVRQIIPFAGHVFIDGVLRTIDITFNNGTIDATVTRKRDGKFVTFHIDITTGEGVEN